MDSDKLPPISPPATPPTAANPAQGGTSGALVPLPSLSGGVSPPPPLPTLTSLPTLTPLPTLTSLPVGVSPPPDVYFSVPAPLLPPHGDSVFLTSTPDELFAGLGESPDAMFAGLEKLTAAAALGPDAGGISGPWQPPPGAYRVGSFIRNTRLGIHLRGCSKCRTESRLTHHETDGKARSKSKDKSAQSGGRRKGRRSGSGKRSGSRKRSGSGKCSGSKIPGKKCSSLCIHLTGGKGGRSSSRKGRRGGSRSRSGKRGGSKSRTGKRGGSQADGEDLLLQHGSEIEMPTAFNRLSVYHNHDFTQMTWEELMALLTTNFHQAQLSDEQVQQLDELKTEILKVLQAGRVKVKDPRLKWKNRKMLLTLQLTHLSRARDIYRALWEALSEHTAHLRRIPPLLEVRAFREVRSFNTDFLKSGCSLLRFTQVPGRLCRGISLYQACVALVIGRRWILRVLERRLKRVSERTQTANAAIEAVLAYKFEELPADRMRVSHLLGKLDALTCWFEDVKTQMLETVQSLHADLEARRQQQVEEAIVTTMDAEVDGEGDWKGLYDFNRCLTGLVEDMAARNALLRRRIDETRSSARRRGRDKEEWHAWLLRQGQGEGHGEGHGDRLNISRTRWLPV